jgi:hypothetical protein
MQFGSKKTKRGNFYTILFTYVLVKLLIFFKKINCILLPQVFSTCVILSKSLNRNQGVEREAAAAALSEFIHHRWIILLCLV